MCDEDILPVLMAALMAVEKVDLLDAKWVDVMVASWVDEWVAWKVVWLVAELDDLMAVMRVVV